MLSCRWVWLSVGLAVVSLFVAACSGSAVSGPAVTADQSTTVEEPAATTEQPEGLPEFTEATRPSLQMTDTSNFSTLDRAIERYYLYREALYYASAPPEVDPDYEPLKDLVTGERAEQVEEFLTTWQSEDYVRVVEDYATITSDLRLPESITIAEKEGSVIAFRDCTVDTSIIRDRITGEVLDEETLTYLLTVVLTYVDGQWRVSEENQFQKYEGVSTCPE